MARGTRSINPRLYLIDGSSQMYRAYHAIRGLTGPDGRSTNAVYGFVTMLRKLIHEQRPDYIAAAFDLAGPTFRTEMAADYKANRAPMPADLAQQVPWVHQACEALGVPVCVHQRYEADDVIGTLAVQAVAAGFLVVIVTGDKDFYQLVTDHVQVYNPKDEGTWYDATGVKERFGVDPVHVVDVLALMGDAIDNVKGVPGIGEKGARELIGSYGSLDRLLDQAASIPQRKYREALVAHAETARQSRELVRIHTDVPLAADLSAYQYRGASRERCFELFSTLGFRSLLMEYAPTHESVETDYDIVRSGDQLTQLVAEIRTRARVGLRVLYDGPSAVRASVVGLCLSTGSRRARYLPLGHSGLDAAGQLDLQHAIEMLRPVLEDPAIVKVGHDVKADALALARLGVVLRGMEDDPMIASYLLDATRATHTLEDIALEHAGYKAATEDALRGRGAKLRPFSDLPIDAVGDFACERADLALQLATRLGPKLEEAGLTPVYRQLEMPLVPVLVAMEQAGVRVDVPALQAQSQQLEDELSACGARVFGLAGEPFNINSPKQLGEILFERLQLPTLKRTGKTRAASTAVEVLEELALSHELPRLILEWRALQKLKGTYVDALPQLVNPQTGRVHTSFNQTVAATGRLSSSDPNLQNIPIRTELGREIRRAFVADPGFVLVSADYSQIELRVLAHLSGDQELADAFWRGEDIHDRTALKVFGSDSGLDKHELRRRAKIINYALLYGKTAFTLAKDIGVPQHRAQEFIDAYFAGFPGVQGYLSATIARARETGVVTTLFGRRRLVPDLSSSNGQVRAAAERATVNMPIQGTAADILKRAMIDVHQALQSSAGSLAARMILTVHDELLVEVRRDQADELASLLRHRMEQAVELSVPLRVDIGVGENWKEAKG